MREHHLVLDLEAFDVDEARAQIRRRGRAFHHEHGGVLRTRGLRQRGLVRGQDDLGGGGQLTGDLDERHVLRGHAFANRAGEHLQLLGCAVLLLDHGIRHRPAAGRGVRHARLACTHVKQLIRTEAQIRPGQVGDAVFGCPLVPVRVVHSQVQVDEPVRQGCGQGVVHTAVAGTVPCGHNAPAIGQGVLTQAAVQHELIGHGLDRRRGLRELIQQQHALALLGQQRGRDEVHGAVLDDREALQVGRVVDRQAHVDHAELLGGGDLTDDVALADARLAPQEDGTLGLEEAGEGGAELGRLHVSTYRLG